MKLNKYFNIISISFFYWLIEPMETNVTFDSANAAYSKGNYDKAIKLYEKHYQQQYRIL